MAALTSTQSGNWNDSATWGNVTPADGDTFTIAQGHIVTVNSDERAGTGFGDMLVRGNLHFATNGKIRINGRITVQGNASSDYSKSNGVSAQDFTEGGGSSGALLSGTGSNILLEFEGTNSDQHGIWIENITYSSWKFDGTTNVTTTNFAADANVEDSYITVDSTTGFAAGDWIAMYCNAQQDYRAKSDEGAWIHDIDASNNRIYTKKFVGPKAIISSASGTSVVVDWSTIFRVGYIVIFGTGNNRNVRTITAINNETKTLTLDSSISGTISSGTEMYETGLDKKHLTDHQVRRHASTVQTALAVDATTVDVSDATDLAVGDVISIDINNDVDTNWDYNNEFTVTGKSSNTLTFSPALTHTVKAGSVVMKVNRSIQIKGVDEDVRAFCYVEYYTDYNRASTREILLKDVEWEMMGGNTGNTFYRASVFVAGYNSRYRDNEYTTNSRQDFQSKYENCVVHNGNNKSQSYTGMNTRHTHGFIHRNCMSFNNGQTQFRAWSSHHDTQFVNNYATRSSYSCYQGDGMYEVGADYSYNYMTRSDDYTVMMYHSRDMNPINYWIILNSENRWIYSYYMPQGTTFKRFHVDGFRYWAHNGPGGTDLNFQDCYIQNKWYKQVPGVYAGYTDSFGTLDTNDYFSDSGTDSRTKADRTGGRWMTTPVHDWCFEENLYMEVEANTNMIWNRGGKEWSFINFTSEYYPMAMQTMWIPGNTALTIIGEFKGQNGGSWTYPYLYAKPHRDGRNGRYQTAYTGQTTQQADSSHASAKSYANGWLESVRFDSAAGVWQQKTLSIAAQKYGYTLLTMYSPDSDNSEEIGYVKNIRITAATPPKNRTSTMNGRIESTTNRKRISGRI